jgi:hypothetical protein
MVVQPGTVKPLAFSRDGPLTHVFPRSAEWIEQQVNLHAKILPHNRRKVESAVTIALVTGITWATTLPDNGPTGGFFRDRQPVPW